MPSTIGELKGIKGGMEIEWKIPNFFSFPETADINYFSPDFYFAGTSWYLDMYPFGQTIRDSIGNINCYLHWRNLPRFLNLDVQIGVKNKDGITDGQCNYTKVFNESIKNWGCWNIIARSELFSRKSDLVPADVLTFICKMTDNEPHIVPSTSLKGTEKLSRDFRDLLLNGNDSDLTVKINDKEYKLHKIILGIRAPIFATEVKKKMEKSSMNVVDISDCEETVFKMFLEYVYTGIVDRDLLQKNFWDLYKIAEKYSIAELNEVCLKFVKDNLSIDTFLDAIELAEKHDEKDLKSSISNFCSDNLKDLVKNPMWLTFMERNAKKAYELLTVALTNYVKSKDA